MRRLCLLGVSGSIGQQTLEVLRSNPQLFSLVAVSVHQSIEILRLVIKEFSTITHVNVGSLEDRENLRKEFPNLVISYGEDGLKSIVTLGTIDMVINAIVGFAGFLPTYEAVKSGKDVALANKESLVSGGEIITDLLKKNGNFLRPIDSEHSAIFQCLIGEDPRSIRRLILTASGGPFRQKNREEIARVQPDDALKHPTWSMGAKITIDSATMMNKGLEIIEAHWLFGIPYDQIDVLIHPESTIHSMVEYIDGSIKAQLATPSMVLPIQLALGYPQRLFNNHHYLPLEKLTSLHFALPSLERFPALRLAKWAGTVGGTLPCVLNAANEVAVHSFLEGQLEFSTIEEIIEETMHKHSVILHPTVEDILHSDAWARAKAHTLITIRRK